MCFHFCCCFFSCYPVGITSFAVGLNICVITAEIFLLAKSKVNRIEVLIYKALIDSNISHDGFVLANNVLKEYHDTNDK